jgi:hypothetical protein
MVNPSPAEFRALKAVITAETVSSGREPVFASAACAQPRNICRIPTSALRSHH